MSTVLTPRAERKKKAIKYFHKMNKSTGKPVLDKDGKMIPLSDNHRSQTLQSKASDANINNIVARYHKTGVLGNPNFARDVKPMFIDMTQIPDFQTANNIIVKAREAFDRLPVEIRNKFDNDPQKLISFVDNPDNKEECIKLGLIQGEKFRGDDKIKDEEHPRDNQDGD